MIIDISIDLYDLYVHIYVCVFININKKFSLIIIIFKKRKKTSK